MEPDRGCREDPTQDGGHSEESWRPQWSPAGEAGKTSTWHTRFVGEIEAAMEPGRGGREDKSERKYPRVQNMPQWSPAGEAGKTQND
jgi:hypothetical protein